MEIKKTNKNEQTMLITIPSDTEQKLTNKTTVIRQLVKVINSQISEIAKYQDIHITQENEEEIKQTLTVVDSLIKDCHTSNEFKCNRNDKFAILTYEFQRLSLKYESYLIKDAIKKMELKEEELNKKQKRLEEKHEKATQESNNLIYNILGFIASYSIVSAAVTTFEKVSSIEDIMIFMVFVAFILLTTLIGLNNFYKVGEKEQTGLRNNRFLWKALLVVFLLMMIYKGISYVKRNRQAIFEDIGRGIEQVREERKEKQNAQENINL